jgi:hypothetical protein
MQRGAGRTLSGKTIGDTGIDRNSAASVHIVRGGP